ncbi:hypothetical protein [Paracidovorax citrulli]|uniref:hypothetical protein n=1 Tax=Paracidovorax citrulli TaxID=80869 RepID=UPI001401EFF1|nr:hypothetical protein [Paracidovorax citrulli]
MYQDITEADRAGGNVSIRQAHVGVLTATWSRISGPPDPFGAAQRPQRVHHAGAL